MEPEILGEIITSGSELMLGEMVDTNSAWLSEILGAAGVRLARHTSVGDDLGRLITTYRRAWSEYHLVVATGGLGPTEDDLTRQAAAEAFGRELEFHEDLARDLRDMFQRRGYTMTDNNLRQAWLPKGSLLVPNPWGTAPGFALADPGRLMIFLPGVPMEMKNMVRAWLLPHLHAHFPTLRGAFKKVVLKTAGLGESLVDSLVGDLMSPGRNPTVGLLAAPDQVRVVVVARGRDEAELDGLLAGTTAELEKRLKGHVFGYNDTSLPQAVAGLLKAGGLSLAIVDALTQGRLSGTLAPALDPENWSGALELPWRPDLPDGAELLRLHAPKANGRIGRAIRLATTARPDTEAPTPREGETALVVESLVQAEFLAEGRPLTQKFHLGGDRHRALSRAAALSTFHLWQVLQAPGTSEK